MPKFHVERSIVIDKPLKEVRNSLINFKEWPKWSPWIIMEPDASIVYSDRQGQVGANYGWSGVLIGAGSMELMHVSEHALKMDLHFVKPFKSQADIYFTLKDNGNSTEVLWSMDSSLPFFMFWMTGKMKTFIGMDYERGLLMLKEYLETGTVDSFVHIEGVLRLEAQAYIGIQRTCDIKKLGEVMKEDFETLFDFMQKHHISQDRVPFSIYNTFDIFKGTTNYVACIPYDSDIELEDTWTRGKLEVQEVLKTTHKGRYAHLGNGWMTAMNFARLKKIKTSKKPVGYEFYPNNPVSTIPQELRTEICLPLR